MTKQEAVLISAYTGYLLVADFSDVAEYCQKVLGRPMYTHDTAARSASGCGNRLRTGSLMAERYTGKPMVITYSGGMDSDVLLHLARRANIPIEVSHGLTTVDAPETVRHVKKVFRELELDGISAHIEFGKYKGKRVTTWELIVQKGIPPTRLMRYCCSVFKESHNKGRMIATGVR